MINTVLKAVSRLDTLREVTMLATLTRSIIIIMQQQQQ